MESPNLISLFTFKLNPSATDAAANCATTVAIAAPRVSQASSVVFRQWVSDGKKVPMKDAIQMVGTPLEKGVPAIIHPDIE